MIKRSHDGGLCIIGYDKSVLSNKDLPLPRQFCSNYPKIEDTYATVHVSFAGQAFIDQVVHHWVPGLEGHSVDDSDIDRKDSVIVFLKFQDPDTKEVFGTCLYNDMPYSHHPSKQAAYKEELFLLLRNRLFSVLSDLSREVNVLVAGDPGEEMDEFKSFLGGE